MLAFGATSIVVFRSTDEGVHWRFLSTLAEAKDFPWSQEGPNEMDLATLDDGSCAPIDGKCPEDY